MATSCIYDSKYKGSDGVLRNTAYNGYYAATFPTGKEFKKCERNMLSLNVRAILAGGKRYTPVMLAESQQNGYAIYDV